MGKVLLNIKRKRTLYYVVSKILLRKIDNETKQPPLQTKYLLKVDKSLNLEIKYPRNFFIFNAVLMTQLFPYLLSLLELI